MRRYFCFRRMDGTVSHQDGCDCREPWAPPLGWMGNANYGWLLPATPEREEPE